MADREIKCAEAGCEDTRLFTERDQEFFAEKGYKDPKYCKYHSAIKKQAHISNVVKTEKPEYEDNRYNHQEEN